jgi:hypothetical protein
MVSFQSSFGGFLNNNYQVNVLPWLDTKGHVFKNFVSDWQTS